MRSSVLKALLGAAVCGSIFAFSAVSASAAVVCNEDDVCWHAKERYTYPPEARITIHEDTWKAGPKVKFREREGRGYWKGDSWTEFK
jgi:hypothetical protein